MAIEYQRIVFLITKKPRLSGAQHTRLFFMYAAIIRREGDHEMSALPIPVTRCLWRWLYP